jgi:hypothetical protein
MAAEDLALRLLHGPHDVHAPDRVDEHHHETAAAGA